MYAHAMTTEDDDDITEDPRFLDALDKALAKRADEDAKRKERSKPPKDFGDAADRFAEAVWDKFEERKAAAKKAGESGDEEPDRGEQGGDGFGAKFLRSIGGAG